MVHKDLLAALKIRSYPMEELYGMFPGHSASVITQAVGALVIQEKVFIGNDTISIVSKNKYHNKRTFINGHSFDSIKESEHYLLLNDYLKKGKITDLELQPKFKIIDAVKYNGKTLQSRYYVADFKYTMGEKTFVVDVKSEITRKNPVYTLKRQMFLLKYPEFVFWEV